MTDYELTLDKPRYGVAEAARILEVDTTTIYRWMLKGEIKYTVMKVGRHAKKIAKEELLRIWNTSKSGI